MFDILDIVFAILLSDFPLWETASKMNCRISDSPYSDATMNQTLFLMVSPCCAFTLQFKWGKKQQSDLSSRKTSITFQLRFAFKSNLMLFLVVFLLLMLSLIHPLPLFIRTIATKTGPVRVFCVLQCKKSIVLSTFSKIFEIRNKKLNNLRLFELGSFVLYSQ